jgi:hypothetical protein
MSNQKKDNQTKNRRNRIIVAVIAGVFVLVGYYVYGKLTSPGSGKPAINQKNTTGPNVAVQGDSTKPNVIAGGSGTTIASIGQTGGVTAQYYYQITFAVSFNRPGRTTGGKAAKGYIFFLDTATKTIHFKPKSGQWDCPFAAIPRQEKDSVNPHFDSESGTSIAAGSATMPFEEETLYRQSTSDRPATPSSGFLLHYDQKPSSILFGDLKGNAYKAILDQPKK